MHQRGRPPGVCLRFLRGSEASRTVQREKGRACVCRLQGGYGGRDGAGYVHTVLYAVRGEQHHRKALYLCGQRFCAGRTGTGHGAVYGRVRGQEIQIAASKVPAFKPGKALKDAVK